MRPFLLHNVGRFHGKKTILPIDACKIPTRTVIRAHWKPAGAEPLYNREHWIIEGNSSIGAEAPAAVFGKTAALEDV